MTTFVVAGKPGKLTCFFAKSKRVRPKSTMNHTPQLVHVIIGHSRRSFTCIHMYMSCFVLFLLHVSLRNGTLSPKFCSESRNSCDAMLNQFFLSSLISKQYQLFSLLLLPLSYHNDNLFDIGYHLTLSAMIIPYPDLVRVERRGVVGWRDCWTVSPVLKFPTQRGTSYCFRLFFLFVYMQ